MSAFGFAVYGLLQGLVIYVVWGGMQFKTEPLTCLALVLVQAETHRETEMESGKEQRQRRKGGWR